MSRHSLWPGKLGLRCRYTLQSWHSHLIQFLCGNDDETCQRRRMSYPWIFWCVGKVPYHGCQGVTNVWPAIIFGCDDVRVLLSFWQLKSLWNNSEPNFLSILYCVAYGVSTGRISGKLAWYWWMYFRWKCLLRGGGLSCVGGIGADGVLVKEASCGSGSTPDVYTKGSSLESSMGWLIGMVDKEAELEKYFL